MLDSDPKALAQHDRIGPRRKLSEALAFRDFRIYWIGQSVSLVGIWMQNAALGWVVVGLTGDATKIAAVSFIASVPVVLFSLYGGVLADRYGRRVLLLWCQTAMGLLAACAAGLVFLHQLTMPHVYTLALLLGLVTAVELPAQRALLPELVPARAIQPAVALHGAAFHGSRLVGPTLAGIIMSVVSTAAVFAVNAVSYLAVIASLLLIRPRPAPRNDQGGWAALREALAYVARHRQLLGLLGFVALTTSFVFPYLVVFTPLVVKELFGGDAAALGLLMSCSGLGAMTGSLLLVKIRSAWRGPTLFGGCVVSAAMLMLLSAVRSPWPAAVLVTIMTLSVSLALGLCVTVLQETVPDQLRGRVLALHGLLFAGLMPTVALLWGLVVQAVDLVLALCLMGAGYVAIGVPWLLLVGAWRLGASSSDVGGR